MRLPTSLLTALGILLALFAGTAQGLSLVNASWAVTEDQGQYLAGGKCSVIVEYTSASQAPAPVLNLFVDGSSAGSLHLNSRVALGGVSHAGIGSTGAGNGTASGVFTAQCWGE